MLRRVLARLRRPGLPAAAGGRRWAGSTPGYEGVPRETADVVVIGAGVVGIAAARELALKGRDVLVLESASTFGTGTSSRNSEVIHAGIYYPRNSLKANLCIRGRELLYKYCSDQEIPHNQVGKLIVATGPAEIPKLGDLLRCGTENGVKGLRILESSEAMQLEPELYCVKALLSPCSGIVDSHSLMLSLLDMQESEPSFLALESLLLTSLYRASTKRRIKSMDTHLQLCKRMEDRNGEETHGIPGLVNLLGIESPGLTSSLAIAEYIASRFSSVQAEYITFSNRRFLVVFSIYLTKHE